MLRMKGIWIDPYRPDPAKPLDKIPPSGTAAAMGIYIASEQRRGAVMVCPGGGYGGLADHEGPVIAEFFNTLGIHAFVLRYRHAPHARHPKPLEDTRRGMRVIRYGARQGWWPVDPAKIAVMGFSAGGHLAATLATDIAAPDADSADPVEREPSRPDGQILCYPVIHMSKTTGHGGSRNNLLGPGAPMALVRSMDMDEQLTEKTPPAFIFHTAEDRVVPVQNALDYATALAHRRIPLDLHIFNPGQHGVGLAKGNANLGVWTELLAQWLKRMGY